MIFDNNDLKLFCEGAGERTEQFETGTNRTVVGVAG